eukprot:TRINITY_DN2940_c0_g2_i2.p1 TRINITY_DN2940_c0_g2~~TRINITY_DN2940_c0_g2_i2.p1  ORF type:complete len:182 (+),score=35.71 TRINITY_DN2940_c0_g2_i2:292-837(+)
MWLRKSTTNCLLRHFSRHSESNPFCRRNYWGAHFDSNKFSRDVNNFFNWSHQHPHKNWNWKEWWHQQHIKATEQQDSSWKPSVDLAETETHIVLHMDLPGLSKEDLKVTVEGSELIVSGERSAQKIEEKQHYQRMERRSGSFQRNFSLPNNVKTDTINATLTDGVLEVKLEKTQKRVIDIN